ncbi:hypothetical protein [Pseudonocardia sp. KRD291]|uniref:hypothetical protein n=1 Tax=Pseudonocardia sp. KRD291 TaxID=2792007 RepID=UPI001C49EB4C|nr:hypothetical protein [Pseudonocardia sp. KRD291]MBW0101523.1 hypothetical protein [Pseudonocardia sp. KRD291]
MPVSVQVCAPVNPAGGSANNPEAAPPVRVSSRNYRTGSAVRREPAAVGTTLVVVDDQGHELGGHVAGTWTSFRVTPARAGSADADE